jgi:carbon monoxide dehydrogenase subunit G
MRLEGNTDIPYDTTDVWTALHDIDVSVKTIPGCKSMEPDGEGGYAVTLSLGVAAIKGEYQGKIRVTDVEYPRHYILDGEGAGNPGYVKTNVHCRLNPNANGTVMEWTCDAEVGGLIAGIGGRVLSGISKYMAKQFFKAFIEEMDVRYEGKRIEPVGA